MDDLFGDIEEALEVGGSYYMGTFILSQKDKSAPLHVVDGQQRLTTLTMLLDTDESLAYVRRTFGCSTPMTRRLLRVLVLRPGRGASMRAERVPGVGVQVHRRHHLEQV